MKDEAPGVWRGMELPGPMWFHTCSDGSLVRTILADGPAVCLACGKTSASCTPFSDKCDSDYVVNAPSDAPPGAEWRIASVDTDRKSIEIDLRWEEKP